MDADKRDVLCAALEKQYVHDVYNKTAHYFTDVRYKAWPRVRQFVLDLPVGTLVADVGCGSGKYLNINKHVVTIGCDYSNNLLQVAGQQGRHVLSCDNLHLPFRDNCFDAIISVGVIHHFTTPSRRARAMQELERVLCPGGRVLIYVWAMEQRHRKFKAQDVLVPWHLKPKGSKQGKMKKTEKSVAFSQKRINSPQTGSTYTYSYSGNIDARHSGTGRSNRPKNLPIQSVTNVMKPQKESKRSQKNEKKSISIDRNGADIKDVIKKHFGIGKKASSPVISMAVPDVARTSHLVDSLQNDPLASKSKSRKMDNFPKLIKNKFFQLIGIEGQEKSFSKGHSFNDKDLKYRELIEKIVKEDSKLFFSPHNEDVIPSVLAFEGFAVREFPGSSRGDSLAHQTDRLHILTERNDQSLDICNIEKACKKADRNVSDVNKPGTCSLSEVRSNFQLVGSELPKSDTQPKADSLLYKQKCADWLEHGKPCYVEEKNSITLDLLVSRTEAYEAKQNHCQREVPEEMCAHTEDQIIKSGSGSNDDVFGSTNEDWAKVTAHVIETIQTHVDSINETTPKRLPKGKQYNDNSGADIQCRCKSGKSSSSPTGENGKEDNVKVSCQRRLRFESSMSSYSSMSSESDSNESDVEEMSVCALCRGDSVEYSSIPLEHEQSKSDTLQQEYRQDKDRDCCLNNKGAFCNNLSRNGQDMNDIVSKEHCADSLVTTDVMAGCPAQTKVQIPKLRSSHDSGYSDVCTNASQEDANASAKSQVRHIDTGTNTISSSEAGDAHKRFYHVFREGELDTLIQKRVKNLTIVESFYDHANWCIIAKKK